MGVIGNQTIVFYHGRRVNDAIAPNDRARIQYGAGENYRTLANLALIRDYCGRVNERDRTPATLQAQSKATSACMVNTNRNDKIDSLFIQVTTIGTVKRAAEKDGPASIGVVDESYALVTRSYCDIKDYFCMAPGAPNYQFRQRRPVALNIH
jgi:hypothetical protein